MIPNMVGHLTVELDGVLAGEASNLAAELRDYLLDEDPDLHVEQARSDPDAQDLGATLLVLLATPTAVAVARGVQRWIARRDTSSVVFRCGTRELTVTNLSHRRADELGRDLVQLLGECEADQ